MEVISITQILQLVLALGFVVALMAGLAYIIKRLGLAQVAPVHKSAKRLKIIESQALDARRRLVLIRCDDKDHLVLLGANGETVVKTDIEPINNVEDSREKTPASN